MSKKKKTKTKVEKDIRMNKRNCLSCRHICSTTSDSIKYCGCWLRGKDLYSQPTAIEHLAEHICDDYVGNDGVSVIGLRFSDEEIGDLL